MSEISDLYHPLILENSRSPKRYQVADRPGKEIEAYNPVCGDQFTIYLDLENDKIECISFSGYGCAVSKAATSVLLDKLEGLDAKSAMKMLRNYLEAINLGTLIADPQLKVFQIAKEYPGRMQCATLSAEALVHFLNNKLK
ncbi:MAG: iron-sulfur cluster assembly scaffold protein [Saprospiraceae bacterium]|nr:iron-sulfur cluster assembly scaffold protein [Saprospiraceae bacterium]